MKLVIHNNLSTKLTNIPFESVDFHLVDLNDVLTIFCKNYIYVFQR